VAVDAMTIDADALDGETHGHEVAGDVDWRWTRTVSATADPDMLRVDIVVMPSGAGRIAAELSLVRDLPR
jgi:general secretion pathway protein I